MDRNTFLKTAVLASTALAYSPLLFSKNKEAELIKPFEISLSQWAFKDRIFGNSRDNYKWFKKTLHGTNPDAVLKGTMDPRDIVVQARKMGVNAVDLVNIMWFGHGNDTPWLNDFKQLAKNEDVSFVCLMCDNKDKIGAKDKASRQRSLDQHTAWLETAAELDCKQLRVNPYSDADSYLEQLKLCAEGMHEMSERAAKLNIELVVENHGHPGSIGAWLNMLVEMTDHENFGVYLDFDNFFMGGWNINPQRRYDRKQGILDLADSTVGVSAKARHFLENGDEKNIDYDWCVKTVLDHGFKNTQYMCAEYEGDEFSNFEGSKKTVALLKKLQKKYSVPRLQEE